MTIGTNDNITNQIYLYGANVNVNRSLSLADRLWLGDSSLTYSQAVGGTDGISVEDAIVIDANSLVLLEFDTVESEGLDWGLRWSGNKQTELQSFIDDGVIAFSGGTQPISVIYNPAEFGDYTYLGYIGAAVPPVSFDVTRGQYVSGGIFELTVSDNLDLSARRNITDIQSRVFVELESISPEALPTQFTFTLEAAVFARSVVVQSVDLYNYTTSSFEQVDSRNATRFSDSVAVCDPTGDLSRFVDPGTNRIQARIRFQSPNPRQQFSTNIDQVIWTIR